ncbi:MAG: 5-formyltetrahydrofolate cyclo-ligase [Thermodesulfovibrionales bacterium]|nr:5-formyltetrahydrofolate cyclo-ligase [Thermodesulfovibrionales bacterium]
MDKRQIRRQVLKQRDSISDEEKKFKDRSIKTSLFSQPEFKEAKKILFYASYKSEVDTFSLIEEAFLLKKTVLLPKVNTETNNLDIYEIKDLKELKMGYQSIPEPYLPESRIVEIKDIDLIIVPGVAFDIQSNRLGYGKGFYDKLLNEKLCPAIALAYEEQVVESVPTEPHDIKMDKIITDKRVISKDGFRED